MTGFQRLGVFLTAAVVSCGVKVIYDTCWFKINNIHLKTPKWPHDTSIRIVQLSDLHNRKFGKENKRLLNAIEHSSPDIVVITGDLIDRKTHRFKDIYTFIEALVNINDKVYFVSGNHEWEHPATSIFLNGLRIRGIKIIDGHQVNLTRDGWSLQLIGAGYMLEAFETNVLAEIPGKPNDYQVLLAHMPDGVDVADYGVDLMLCGHTHGGQVRLPFIGAMVAPGQGLLPRRAKGIYHLPNQGVMHIDSGLGTTHIPVRFMNQSQFSVIDIEGSGN